MRPIPVNTEAVRLLVHYASILKNEDMAAAPKLQSLVSAICKTWRAGDRGNARCTAAANGRGVPAARLRASKPTLSKI